MNKRFYASLALAGLLACSSAQSTKTAAPVAQTSGGSTLLGLLALAGVCAVSKAIYDIVQDPSSLAQAISNEQEMSDSTGKLTTTEIYNIFTVGQEQLNLHNKLNIDGDATFKRVGHPSDNNGVKICKFVCTSNSGFKVKDSPNLKYYSLIVTLDRRTAGTQRVLYRYGLDRALQDSSIAYAKIKALGALAAVGGVIGGGLLGGVTGSLIQAFPGLLKLPAAALGGWAAWHWATKTQPEHHGAIADRPDAEEQPRVAS